MDTREFGCDINKRTPARPSVQTLRVGGETQSVTEGRESLTHTLRLPCRKVNQFRGNHAMHLLR